jgi:hypothetical protein
MHRLAHLRQRLFFGTMLLGGLAGLCEAAWDDQGLLFNFFCGLIVVTLGGFVGSFAGFFLKNCWRWIRGAKDYSGDFSDGILLGSLVGTVLGIVAQTALGSAPHTALGAGAGALVGGLLGALPDETMLGYVLTALYDEESPLAEAAETCDS